MRSPAPFLVALLAFGASLGACLDDAAPGTTGPVDAPPADAFDDGPSAPELPTDATDAAADVPDAAAADVPDAEVFAFPDVAVDGGDIGSPCNVNSDCAAGLFCCDPAVDLCEPDDASTCLAHGCGHQSGALRDIRRHDGGAELTVEVSPIACLDQSSPDAWYIYRVFDEAAASPVPFAYAETPKSSSGQQVLTLDGMHNGEVYGLVACPSYNGVAFDCVFGGSESRPLWFVPAPPEDVVAAIAVPDLRLDRPALPRQPLVASLPVLVTSEDGFIAIDGLLQGAPSVRVVDPNGVSPRYHDGVGVTTRVHYAAPNAVGDGWDLLSLDVDVTVEPASFGPATVVASFADQPAWEISTVTVAPNTGATIVRYSSQYWYVPLGGSKQLLADWSELRSVDLNPGGGWAMTFRRDAALYGAADPLSAATSSTLLLSPPAFHWYSVGSFASATAASDVIIYATELCGHSEVWATDLTTGARTQLTGTAIRHGHGATFEGGALYVTGTLASGETGVARLLVELP